MAPKEKFLAETSNGPMLVSWASEDEKVKVLNGLSYEGALTRTRATSIYQDVAPNNVSIRDGFDRRDYDFFRPGERTPRTQIEIIASAMQAYERVGIIRNVFDMMGDFISQGACLVHQDSAVEAWHDLWWKKVNGRERTERISNVMIRAGTSVVQRHTAKLRVKNKNELMNSYAKPDLKMKKPMEIDGNEIPICYTIHNPVQLEVLGGELAVFTGAHNYMYGIKIPLNVAKMIKNPKSEYEKQLVDKLPEVIRQGIKDNLRIIPLNSDKIIPLFYKKDDWQVWPTPMITPILTDLQMLYKMKLADLVALDGAISQIRLWRLGSMEHKIFPTQNAIDFLRTVLSNNVGGGTLDLVWGPEIDLKETSTDVYKFLGMAKYEAALHFIYGGLGIPPTLTGGGGKESGFSNNFISLRTLTERLQYIRDILVGFWNKELVIIQKAMGFRKPAEIVFDRMSLTDEAAEKQLLINLADRDIISHEYIQERFGAVPEIENNRIIREKKARDEQVLPPKASPFHNANTEDEIYKILAQNGNVTPTELGISLDERAPGEKTPVEIKHEQDLKISSQKAIDKTKRVVKKSKLKGQPGQGRPKKSFDKKKRKQRTVKPRTAASFIETATWAEDTQKYIYNMLKPGFLKSLNKTNARQLTDDESNSFENLVFAVLCSFSPSSSVYEKEVQQAIASELKISQEIENLLQATINKITEKEGKEPSIDKVRQTRAQVYALYHTRFGEENGED